MTINAVPLRVDLAGGWLDVPRLARPRAYVVNCAISPLVSLDDWPYERGGGLGGSAAHAILCGRDGVASEFHLGVGWQDPAVILETGLCVWRSGPMPSLECKVNPDFLAGKMALHWTGQGHFTPSHTLGIRDYAKIQRAGDQAKLAALAGSVEGLANAVVMNYDAQRNEGMDDLPSVGTALAWKYCGGGWGGYALYLFLSQEARDASGLLPIEPYMRIA